MGKTKKAANYYWYKQTMS